MELKNIEIKTNSSEHYENEFTELAIALVNYGASVGVTITPFSGAGLPYFSRLSVQDKHKVLSRLRTYVEICAVTVENNHKLTDSLMFTWSAIKHFNLVPSSDLFSKISSDDIVEIYDTENIQIFRNFKFFSVCSYTLEDIFCRPWPTLFNRPDAEMTGKILEVVVKMFSGETPGTVSPQWDPHEVEEVNSPFKFNMTYRLRAMSLLKNKEGQPAGIVAVEQANLLRTPSPGEKERLLWEYYEMNGNLELQPDI